VLGNIGNQEEAITRIDRILTHHFKGSIDNRKRFSEVLLDIDSNMHKWSTEWIQKSAKLEKASDSMLYNLNNVNKYIREQKSEMDTLKHLVKMHQEKFNITLVRRIDANLDKIVATQKTLQSESTLIMDSTALIQKDCDKIANNFSID